MRTAKLKDITLTITDGKHGDCKNHDGSGYYFISCKDVYDETIHYENARQITEDDFRDADRRTNLAAYDILITNSGTIGRMALVKDIPETRKTTFQKSVAIVRADTSQVVPNYLYYLLKSKVHDFINSSNGSAQKNLLLSTMRDFDISFVDSFETQHRIASILSRYDSLIENYQKQIKLLEEAAQRLYKEWFVDLRFPGHENTKIVDGVPEGWEEKSIMEVFDFKYGKILPTKDFVEDGPIPVYGASKQIGRYTKANCFEPKVLIGSRGNAGFVHRTIEDETYVTNNSFIVEPTKEYTFLRLPYIYESFKAMDFVAICTGAAQPQLTLNSIASLKYIVPTKKLITIYCDVSISFFTKIAMSYKQIRLLIEARDRLLPKLMSGEINVES